MNGEFTVDENGTSVWTGKKAASSGPSKQIPSGAPKAQSGENAALEKLILGAVNDQGMIADTADFTSKHNISPEELDPVLKSLESLEYLVLEVIERRQIVLTEEGQSYAANGSPEFQFVSAMKMGEKVDMAEMEGRVGAQIAKIG